jgi:hypothetical protein
VAAEQDKVSEVKDETKTEARTSSRWPPNRIVQFPKSDHPVSSASEQKKPSRTIVPGTAQTPHLCPPDLTSS